jgi:HD-GYP domain-containing protein (c-di-GMP phosphodiesterase class II)
MKSSPSDAFVDVCDLEVGMFIQLDLGWMSHPFPLSSFRLSAPDQIATLRSLGLTRVRWLPLRSDARFARAAAGVAEAPPATTLEAVEAPAPASPAQRAEAAAQRERRRLLAVQREAVQTCERQFAEATQACRQVFDLIGSEPHKASAQCEALTQAFLDKMLVGEPDLSLRLLSEGAGDKVALHAINVGVISLLMGRVFGMSADDMLDLGVGALLHDVGKAELPERLRFRAEHFTPSEQKYYEEHVGHGIATGRRMGLRAGALLVIGQHHEHADGSGFPLHLGSDRLTFAARIVALANRYDNLCNPPIPAKALTPHEALSLMFAQGKNQFDTAIMGAFIKMMGVYPPGSAVQLTDDRYALVTAVNSTRPLKPRVLVYDPKVPRDEALLIDLQLAPGLGIRRSLKPLALPRPALDYLSPRPRTVYFFEPASAVEAVEALEAAA